MPLSQKDGNVQCVNSSEPAESIGSASVLDCKPENIKQKTRPSGRVYMGTIDGNPCAKCGHTERYFASGNCVNCKRMKQRDRHREKPRKKDEPDYVPNPMMAYWLTRAW